MDRSGRKRSGGVAGGVDGAVGGFFLLCGVCGGLYAAVRLGGRGGGHAALAVSDSKLHNLYWMFNLCNYFTINIIHKNPPYTLILISDLLI